MYVALLSMAVAIIFSELEDSSTIVLGGLTSKCHMKKGFFKRKIKKNPRQCHVTFTSSNSLFNCYNILQYTFLECKDWLLSHCINISEILTYKIEIKAIVFLWIL